MKKYIVFQYDQYYPAGGLGDVVDSFDTLEDAQTFVQEHFCDYNEIVDRDTWKVIDEPECEVRDWAKAKKRNGAEKR